MFIYNVTTKISWNINDAWVAWMKEEHMPAIINTNCFIRCRFLKLHEQDDEEGPTYVAQYFTESKALYNKYIELYSDKLFKATIDKWGDNFISFRTLLETVD
ncbi:MAG TPA: DUF4286 family protein [Parafilimonas sp.]|nr:DUF4286 family protein [Parafilimonas sp.]